MIMGQNKYVYNKANSPQTKTLGKKEFLAFTHECRDIDRRATDDTAVLSVG